jgi:hypothetical protein
MGRALHGPPADRETKAPTSLAGPPAMTEVSLQTRQGKFRDPDWTASGERRASVPLEA